MYVEPDDEFTKKIIKIICDVKKSKLAFKRIVNEVNFSKDNSPEEEYTIIGKKELSYLKDIESRFFKIGDIARKMYKILG